ncbi:MAG TPA: SO2930 family diheme c-type cytochrome [Novosphingobium sp.]|nr:SO2930 family diheme c-type cytochrome [Novosphingobium sp.]
MKVLFAALMLAGAAVTTAAPPSGVRDAAVIGSAFPATLAEFGFFNDASASRPAVGVTPYRLNTPLWSDGADKHRFLYLPPGARAVAQGEGLLELPVGAALIKTFVFGPRKVETRVLLHRAEGWVALPYQWNEAQTEARLVIAGARVSLTTPTGQAISYAIPNKNQCKECHALAGAVVPIGPKARNLDAAWLTALHRAGRLDTIPVVARRVPVWEQRAKAPIAAAARGYLDANCAHCHNPAGSASNSGLDLRWEQSDRAAIGIAKRPVAAGRGAGTFEYDIAPGDPEHSILLYRMRSLEGGVAMPELGRATVDEAGVATVRAWIASLR